MGIGGRSAPLAPWLQKLPLGIGAEGIKSGFVRAKTVAGMPWLNFRNLRRNGAKVLIKNKIDLDIVNKLLGAFSSYCDAAKVWTP